MSVLKGQAVAGMAARPSLWGTRGEKTGWGVKACEGSVAVDVAGSRGRPVFARPPPSPVSPSS